MTAKEPEPGNSGQAQSTETPLAVDADTKSAEADIGASPAGEQSKSRREVGGRDGPEPTRFGDWEKNGRCIDF